MAAVTKRRPTHHRSDLRDNRWRRTLPEAKILIRKLLGLSTSKYLYKKFEVMDYGRDRGFQATAICRPGRHKIMSETV
jgi:hypothetical protein